MPHSIVSDTCEGVADCVGAAVQGLGDYLQKNTMNNLQYS